MTEPRVGEEFKSNWETEVSEEYSFTNDSKWFYYTTLNSGFTIL